MNIITPDNILELYLSVLNLGCKVYFEHNSLTIRHNGVIYKLRDGYWCLI